eukprot:130775_1
MIKRESSLDIAPPILQKLHNICTNIKSLLQVITGMTKIEKLAFELPDLLINNNNISENVSITTSTSNPSSHVKKKRKKKRRSQTHGHKMDNIMGTIRDSIKQNKTASKSMMIRKHSSQKVVIYEHDDDTEIINDYHENNKHVSNNTKSISNTTNHQYSQSFDAVNSEKYRQALVQRNNLSKIIHRPHPKPKDIDPLLFVEPIENKRQEYNNTQRQPPPPAMQKRKKSMPPAIKTQIDKKNIVKTQPTLKQMCLSVCLEEFKISKNENEYGLIMFIEKYLGLTYLKKIFNKFGINEIVCINE